MAGPAAGAPEPDARPPLGLDRLKDIPLDAAGDVRLSLGASLREQFETYHNAEFGLAPGDDDAYWLHRALLNADLRWGDGVRVFGELGNALLWDRAIEPSPVDENELHLHQAFLELTTPDAGPWRLRVGRQEMPFGSGRLVSTRDGPNTRLSFDAIRVTAPAGAWTIDGFFGMPVDLEPGIFDDRIGDDTRFWGVYATGPLGAACAFGLDLYVLGIDREDRAYGGVRGDERRHSFGARLHGSARGFDVNAEAVLQVGTLGNADIEAWTVASDWGYTWHDAAWTPRLGLRANISSGARGDDATVETFDPLFPNNSYFSEAAVVFPANLIDVNPTLTLAPTEALRLEMMWDVLWRTSTEDAVYGPPGVPIVPAGASDARFVGHSVSLLAAYELDRFQSISLALTQFFAGNAVEDAGGRDVSYLAAWYTFRF